MTTAILYVAPQTSPETVEYIKTELCSIHEGPLYFDVSVKESLLGGFIAVVDGKIYDASLSTDVAEMKKHLLLEEN